MKVEIELSPEQIRKIVNDWLSDRGLIFVNAEDLQDARRVLEKMDAAIGVREKR